MARREETRVEFNGDLYGDFVEVFSGLFRIWFGEEIRRKKKWCPKKRVSTFNTNSLRFVPATFGSFATNIVGHNRQTLGFHHHFGAKKACGSWS